jgi:hypothetical protein
MSPALPLERLRPRLVPSVNPEPCLQTIVLLEQVTNVKSRCPDEALCPSHSSREVVWGQSQGGLAHWGGSPRSNTVLKRGDNCHHISRLPCPLRVPRLIGC